MSAIFTELQMADLPPLDQARKAIAHVLGVLATNPALAYYIGPGSQSWALLTEASATLHGFPVEVVRRAAVNPKARGPREGLAELMEVCNRLVAETQGGRSQIGMQTRAQLVDAIELVKGGMA